MFLDLSDSFSRAPTEQPFHQRKKKKNNGQRNQLRSFALPPFEPPSRPAVSRSTSRPEPPREGATADSARNRHASPPYQAERPKRSSVGLKLTWDRPVFHGDRSHTMVFHGFFWVETKVRPTHQKGRPVLQKGVYWIRLAASFFLVTLGCTLLVIHRIDVYSIVCQ